MPVGFTFNVLDVDKFMIRDKYGKVLSELAEENPDIVVLTADLEKSNKTGEFAAAHPGRFFNFGIAEQNMMGAAAGFAASGKIPYVATFATFASLRCAEQVHTDIAYPDLKVRILATHAGLSLGIGGPTHHAISDIAIMRGMPNMTVFVPADGNECARGVRESVDRRGPIYMRLGRGSEPVVYKKDYDFEFGRAVTVREGGDISLIACGIAVMACIRAARKLEEEGIEARVLDMHTIKPLDEDAVIKAAEETGAVLTVEEHSIIGGLGSAVAEVLAEAGPEARFERLGIPDVFSPIGNPDELISRYGLDDSGVYSRARNLLETGN